MKFNLNSKLLFFIIILFIFINLLDVITAMSILPGEANPIYLLTHSHFALWGFKFLIFGLILYVYFRNKYPNRFWYFSFVYLLIIGTLAVSLGVTSNIYGMFNEEVVNDASKLSTSQKVSYYANVVGVTMIIPYIIAMLVFAVYDKTEKHIVYTDS